MEPFQFSPLLKSKINDYIASSQCLNVIFSPYKDGANIRCQCSGDGLATVWPGEPGRIWVWHATPRGQASLLRDHTHGRHEGSSKFILMIKRGLRRLQSIHYFIWIQVVHDISSEKLFLRDLVAAGAVTDLTGGLWGRPTYTTCLLLWAYGLLCNVLFLKNNSQYDLWNARSLQGWWWVSTLHSKCTHLLNHQG